MQNNNSNFIDTPKELEENPFTPTSLRTTEMEIYPNEVAFRSLYRTTRHGKFHILKTLKPEYRQNPLYRAMLQKEFELAYELNHPHIIQTYDLEEHPVHGLAILEEYVDGLPLNEFIEREGVLDRKLCDKIILQLCDALSYVHSKQIVHRDIKPQNILITHNGFNVKLIDYGLADADAYCYLKQPVGTTNYIAPEVLEGSGSDYRCDIFSLGVVVSDMLGGRPTGKYRRIVRRATDVLNKRYNSINQITCAIQSRNRGWMWWLLLVAIIAITSATLILDTK